MTMIHVQNLNYTYLGASDVTLKGLDFDIKQGEIVGFLGPSGAGKSTTQKILIGLLKDYKGTVSVFDKALHDWQNDYFERIGVSFELPNHFLKLTALENLRYFAALYQAQTHTPETVLADVGLEKDGAMLVSQFSKGMKSRLSVARALIHKPELLFMDEPTAGLDPVNAERIKNLIWRQKEAGKTVFLTTHDMAIADALCDRVAFIVEGEIATMGTPRDLKLQYGTSRVEVEFSTNGRLQKQEFALEKLGQNDKFLRLLAEENIQTIHSCEATLDRVFIEVTGRSLA